MYLFFFLLLFWLFLLFLVVAVVVAGVVVAADLQVRLAQAPAALLVRRALLVRVGQRRRREQVLVAVPLVREHHVVPERNLHRRANTV